MISIFPANATDFSKNGECILDPTSCLVNETLNGEWELQLVHPLDDWNKWTWLQAGNIIKAPVPSSMTPRVKMMQASEGKSIYRINTSYSPLNLWDRPSRYRSLAQYKKGLDVQVISTANPAFYEVIAPDGKRGWMASEYLLFLRTELTNAAATGQVVEPRQLRDQPFRIYRVVPELTQVTAYARHIFYDLLDNMIYQYKPANGTAGNIVAEGIMNACETEHLFNVFSDITKSVDGMDIQNTNPAEAYLGEGGLIDLTSGELARDWFDVFAMTRVGIDTDIQIRQGKNLLGISYDVNDSNVVTRIVPTGETKDGELLYLEPKYVDSPHIGDYPRPRWIHLPVSEAKVSDDMTASQAKAKLLQAAQDEFGKGCDLPDISINVDFLNLADTEEYAQYKPLTDIFLGDSVWVIVQKLGLEVALRMTEYSYDCLLRRYKKMTLGSASETMAGSMISPRQLPTGGIKGMKFAMGSVGTGQLQNMSIGSLQVKTAAIGAAHIQDAAIETAHIQDATIATAKIQDAAITSAKIGTAAIETANIKDAAITSAKIGTAAIETANIKDAAITSAKIGTAAIDTANIKDAAITNAKIGNAAIQTANIQDASITNAKIGLEQVHSSHIVDAAITDAKIANAAITTAKIADAAIDTAKIRDAVITTAHISDGTITSAKIGIAAVDSAAIKDAAITNAKIGLAAVEAANIMDAAIDTAKLKDAAITTAKIGTAAIESANIKDAAITSAKISSAAVDTANIKDAAILSAKIHDAAITNAKIEDGAITRLKVADGAIGNAQIGNAAIDSAKIGNAAIQTVHIGTGVVGTEQVADGSITDAKIVDLTANKITAGTIDAAAINVINLNAGNLTVGMINGQQIANNAIGSQHVGTEAINNSAMLGSDVVTAKALAAGAVTADAITAGIISAEMMAVNAIGTEHITSSAITADKIVAGAITADKLAAASVLANNIAAGAVTANKIAVDTIEASHIKAGAIQTNHVAPQFGDQIVISNNPALGTISDAVTAEQNRATAVENQIKEFTDKAGGFFIFDVSNGKMIIGKNGSPFTSEFSSDKLSFLQGGSEVAYISNNQLYISNAQVLHGMVIGDGPVSAGKDGYVTMDTTAGGLRASWRAS